MDASSPVIFVRSRPNPPPSQLPLYVYTPPGPPPPPSNDLGLVLPPCMSPSSHHNSQWDAFYPGGPPGGSGPGLGPLGSGIGGPPRPPPPPHLWNTGPPQRPPGLPPNAPFFRCPAPTARPPGLPGLKFFDRPPVGLSGFRPPFPQFLHPDFFSTPPPPTSSQLTSQQQSFRPPAFFDGRLPEAPAGEVEDPSATSTKNDHTGLFINPALTTTTAASMTLQSIAGPATDTIGTTVSLAAASGSSDPLVSRPPPAGFKGPSPPRASFATHTTASLLQPLVTSTPGRPTESFLGALRNGGSQYVSPPPGFPSLQVSPSDGFEGQTNLKLQMESLSLGSSLVNSLSAGGGAAGVIGSERNMAPGHLNLSQDEFDRCSPIRSSASGGDALLMDYSALSPDSGIAEAHGFEEDFVAVNFMGEELIAERRPLLSPKERVEIEGEFDRIYLVYSECLQSIKDVHTEFLDLEQRLAQARQEEHRDEEAVKMIQEELKLRHRVLFDSSEYRRNTQRVREMERQLLEIKRVVLDWDQAVADRILVGNLMEENRRQSRLVSPDNPATVSPPLPYLTLPTVTSSSSSASSEQSIIRSSVCDFSSPDKQQQLLNQSMPSPISPFEVPNMSRGGRQDSLWAASQLPVDAYGTHESRLHPFSRFESGDYGMSAPLNQGFQLAKPSVERRLFPSRSAPIVVNSFAAAVMTNQKSSSGMIRLGTHNTVTSGSSDQKSTNAKLNAGKKEGGKGSARSNAWKRNNHVSAAPKDPTDPAQTQGAQKGNGKSTPSRACFTSRRRSRAKKSLQLNEVQMEKQKE